MPSRPSSEPEVPTGTDSFTVSKAGIVTVTLASKAAEDTVITLTVAQLDNDFEMTRNVTVKAGSKTA